MQDISKSGLSWFMDMYVSVLARRALMRSWGSVYELLPRGGDLVWGDSKTAPDDDPLISENRTLGTMLWIGNESYSVSGAMDLFLNESAVSSDSDTLLLGRARVNFDANVARLQNQETARRTILSHLSPFRTRDDTEYTTRSPSTAWSNPLAVPLPRAPNMKILCMYGVGINTERGYFYEAEKTPTGVTIESTEDCPVEPSLVINRSQNFNFHLSEVDPNLDNKAQVSPEVRSGVAYSDGDGLVPIISLGLMCTDSEESGVGWGPGSNSSLGVHRTNSRNPGGAEVTIREYKHEGRSTFEAVRTAAGGGEFRGSKSADHVDILGNYEVCSHHICVVQNLHLKKCR